MSQPRSFSFSAWKKIILTASAFAMKRRADRKESKINVFTNVRLTKAEAAMHSRRRNILLVF